MKRILRTFLVEILVLYLASQAVGGLVFENGVSGMLITAVALTVATFLVKPIVNILLLPLNILTFGLFKWASQALVLFLVDLVLDKFSVVGFSFPGLTTELVVLPAFNLQGVFAYIGFSFLFSLLTSVIYWLVD